MIHPSTEIRFINPEIGYGIFATAFIPKGTLTYVRDALEIKISRVKYDNLPDALKEMVDKYSYIEASGHRILSWDLGNYVNHRCDCNTLSTAYGFEIAIKDILPGEEITDDYGLFNVSDEFPVSCECESCRKIIRPTDIEQYHDFWDAKIKEALMTFRNLEQPLLPFLETKVHRQLMDYLEGAKPYSSVSKLELKTKAKRDIRKLPKKAKQPMAEDSLRRKTMSKATKMRMVSRGKAKRGGKLVN